MDRFAGEDILKFLRAADRHLKKPFPITVIGGAAATLSFGAKRPTMDIDTIDDIFSIRDVWERAAKESGLHIPLSTCRVFEAPYFYEQ